MNSSTNLQKVKQPSGFYVLFLTEMWERFGFYLINSLLILYLTKAMGYDDKSAYTIFAAFSALLYITPPLGGYIADRFLGYRRTLTLGAALLTVGYAVLALPLHQLIYPALACVIMGTGFFKSMPYSLLNQLYRSEAQRKKMDGAFTMYYLSIQIGGLVPLFLGGFLVRALGWHPTFAMGMVGMSIGFITFVLGRRCFVDADIAIGYKKTNYFFLGALFIGSVFIMAIIALLLEHTTATQIFIWSITAAVLSYVAFKARRLNNNERFRLIVAVGLTALGAVFFALYYQQPMSLTLFIDRNVNRNIFGFTMPSSSFWVWNPIWILIIGPCLSQLYNWLGQKNHDLSITLKFGIGIIFMGIGYLVIVVGTAFTNSTQHISSGWIAGSYAFQSTAELMVNALGTAMIAKLVHKSLLNVMMGVWFIGTSVGGLVAGNFANLTAAPAHATALETLHIYSHAFSIFAAVSISIGIVVCLIAPAITRMVQENKYVEAATFEHEKAMN